MDERNLDTALSPTGDEQSLEGVEQQAPVGAEETAQATEGQSSQSWLRDFLTGRLQVVANPEEVSQETTQQQEAASEEQATQPAQEEQREVESEEAPEEVEAPREEVEEEAEEEEERDPLEVLRSVASQLPETDYLRVYDDEGNPVGVLPRNAKLRLKVDGEIKEVPVDKFIRNAQVLEAADKRMKEASERLKAVEKGIQGLAKAIEEQKITPELQEAFNDQTIIQLVKQLNIIPEDVWEDILSNEKAIASFTSGLRALLVLGGGLALTYAQQEAEAQKSLFEKTSTAVSEELAARFKDLQAKDDWDDVDEEMFFGLQAIGAASGLEVDEDTPAEKVSEIKDIVEALAVREAIKRGFSYNEITPDISTQYAGEVVRRIGRAIKRLREEAALQAVSMVLEDPEMRKALYEDLKRQEEKATTSIEGRAAQGEEQTLSAFRAAFEGKI